MGSDVMAVVGVLNEDAKVALLLRYRAFTCDMVDSRPDGVKEDFFTPRKDEVPFT